MDNKDFVTDNIGIFGRFQWRRIFIIQFLGVFCAWQTLVVSPSLLSQFPFQSSSFMFPEVEFWCSPAELELELGERPDVSVSPVVTETNTTDHCLLLTEGDNTTQCSRQASPPGVGDCSEELLRQQSFRAPIIDPFRAWKQTILLQ